MKEPMRNAKQKGEREAASKAMQKDLDTGEDTMYAVLIGMLVLVSLIAVFNIYQIQKMKGNVDGSPIVSDEITDMTMQSASSGITTLSGIDVVPKGIPAVYGKELGVSFDDVSAADPQGTDAAIKKLAVLDQSIRLSGKDKERYITIASQISCEYCCGAPAIITKDGEAACGCAHSFAMRGLAKYLIKYHGDSYTDDQVLEELGKWKTLFFPGPITKKAEILKQKGVALNYINLASNRYRGIEKGTGSGAMVGGC